MIEIAIGNGVGSLDGIGDSGLLIDQHHYRKANRFHSILPPHAR